MANGDGGDSGIANSVRNKISRIYRELESIGYSKIKDFAAGLNEKRMRDFAEINNIELPTKSFYIGVKSLSHARRATKIRDNKAVSVVDIAEFPSRRKKMNLYYDGAAFVYTDYRNKFIINPSYENKNGRRVVFVTATRVTDPNEFNLPKYIEI